MTSSTTDSVAPKITILDAGPCITFCAAAKHSLLIDVLQRGSNELHVPDVVNDEVSNRGSNSRIFPPSTVPNWEWLVKQNGIGILDSSVSAEDAEELSAAVKKLSGTPLAERLMESKDLGELMVIAHAMVRRDRGEQVFVVIDEYRAQRLAAKFHIRVIDTEWILSSAVKRGYIADRGEMRKTYDLLRQYDLGLVDISQTNLLSKALWKQKPVPETVGDSPATE